MATPFFLMGELDHLLSRVMSDNFSMDEIRALCDVDGTRKLLSYDELTMGDYQSVLQNPSEWSILVWPLDRQTFARRLSELRNVRNSLMHFNPDPIPDNVVSQLRDMIRLLKKYAFD